MDQILYNYKPVDPTTWVYISSLLTITVYFKFSRVWSVRNLDLLGLIALAPGLLLVQHGGTATQVGYIWLFATAGFFLVRLLADPMMVRRPLLEPNLSPGGLAFSTVALCVFLMVNVMTKKDVDLDGAQRAEELSKRELTPQAEQSLATHGPGYPLLHVVASVASRALVQPDAAATPESEDAGRLSAQTATARTAAILSHLAVVLGMILIGARHFGSMRTGIAAATLYLLLPYTAQMTGRVDHVLPAALIVWAIFAYRRPLVSGMLLGLATGVIYYPIFLLPLWLGFYWQRGLLRFLVGFVSMVALLIGSLFLVSGGFEAFLVHAKQMFGWTSLSPHDLTGFWSYYESANPYRVSVLAAYAAVCASFALWPAPKNLGTLLSCSAVVMLGTQFWHPQGGGLYMCWYLPLLLLTIFRPNLEDRVALSVTADGWLTSRKRQPSVRAA
ncbi:MAG: hypothetical protein HYX69_01815 [Planctomycetia bacterium]|nr:hypothetical protein [Planctomycetia bacterium]